MRANFGRARNQNDRNKGTSHEAKAAEAALQKAERTAEELAAQFDVLENETYLRQRGKLTTAAHRAESGVLAEEQTYELEKTKEEKLYTQIKNCKSYAPRDGVLRHVKVVPGREDTIPIGLGARVHERQLLFSVAVVPPEANSKAKP